MGTIQQQPCEFWITTERNALHHQKDVFDFVKDRQVISNQRVSFPCSFNLHHATQAISFSCLQDSVNQLFSLSLQGTSQILMKFAPRPNRPIVWRYLCQNDVVELEEGDSIKLGKVELFLKELRFIQPRRPKSRLKKQQQELLSIKPHERSVLQSPLRNSGHFGKSSGYFGKHHYSNVKDSDIISMKKSMGRSGVSAVSNNEKSCRICFDSVQTRSNPLFNICLCMGSVKFVHFQCLRSWFRSKTVRYETPHCLYYCYQPLSCQICKYAISNEVVHEGRKYSLYEYEQIHPPFAKLEHFADGKVYEVLIRLEEPLDISVGRGADNDVNLNDSSISRSHCMLQYSTQRLFLRSLNCRYGTFVELSGNVEIGEQPLGLNIANHMVWLLQKARPTSIVHCCQTEGKTQLVVEH